MVETAAGGLLGMVGEHAFRRDLGIREKAVIGLAMMGIGEAHGQAPLWLGGHPRRLRRSIRGTRPNSDIHWSAASGMSK
jgi:hypothetical protein